MKISISEARKRLPELLRRVREGGDAAVRITVHDEVVAELRAVLPEPEPGAAARKLLELMEKLPKHKGPKKAAFENVKAHLYGRGGVSR
jgi:antitoxin (DNA-binding transcriptional repressor) of toxin-antitoxin stability system